jgi:hypothetical protein
MLATFTPCTPHHWRPEAVLVNVAVAGATAYIPAKPPPTLAERGRTFERARGLPWCGPVRPAFLGRTSPYGLPSIVRPKKGALARSFRLVRTPFLRECKRSHPPLCSQCVCSAPRGWADRLPLRGNGSTPSHSGRMVGRSRPSEAAGALAAEREHSSPTPAGVPPGPTAPG